MTISEIKEKYHDKWIVVQVTKTDEFGQACEGKVLAACDTSEKAYGKMQTTTEKLVTTVYTGETPPLVLGAKKSSKSSQDL